MALGYCDFSPDHLALYLWAYSKEARHERNRVMEQKAYLMAASEPKERVKETGPPTFHSRTCPCRHVSFLTLPKVSITFP